MKSLKHVLWHCYSLLTGITSCFFCQIHTLVRAEPKKLSDPACCYRSYNESLQSQLCRLYLVSWLPTALTVGLRTTVSPVQYTACGSGKQIRASASCCWRLPACCHGDWDAGCCELAKSDGLCYTVGAVAAGWRLMVSRCIPRGLCCESSFRTCARQWGQLCYLCLRSRLLRDAGSRSAPGRADWRFNNKLHQLPFTSKCLAASTYPTTLTQPPSAAAAAVW